MYIINDSHRKRCSPLHRWLIERRLRKLKLDNNQAEKLDILYTCTTSVDNKPHSVIQECITAMMADDSFNREQVQDLIRTATDQQAERATAMVAAFGEFYEQLEPWQQQQLRDMRHKRRYCWSRHCH
jgi:Spy/CpxP family protein refolding chaperone